MEKIIFNFFKKIKRMTCREGEIRKRRRLISCAAQRYG